MIEIIKLENNLKVITHPLKGTEAVTVLVLIATGSRFEKSSERGISHFLEHMFFKGGKKFTSSREVAAVIDNVGGDFNAFTGKEYTGFYVKLAQKNEDIAFDVLSDMLLHAQFDQNEIEKERGVILEEYNMYQDTPIYQIGWDFEKLLFANHPMAWDQIGTKERIKNFTQEDFLHYKKSCYTNENITIVVTGNISSTKVIKKIKKYFPIKNNQKARKAQPFKNSDQNKNLSIKNKKTEQGHLVLGFPGVPFGSKEELSARILATILGGNMSSRMFINIRDKMGLCYSIRTSTDHFSDVGVISTYAGVDIKRFKEAVVAIKNEYEKIKDQGISEEELEKAKNFLIGKITLHLEDSEEMASFLGTQAVLKGKVKSETELFKKIENITSQEINNLAKNLFKSNKMHLAAIGPFEDKKQELLEILG